MRRFRVTTAVVVCLFLASTPFTGQTAETTGNTIIRVKGANCMARLLDRLASDFMKEHPDVSVVVSGGGTDAGLEAMAEKRVEVVMASRTMYPKERQMLALGGVSPGDKLIGRDCVAFVTRPDNPVSELTLDNIGHIYGGEIPNWKDVGGPDAPIVVIAGNPMSGSALLLTRNVVPWGFFGEKVISKDYFSEIVREVSWETHMAIGYADLATALAAEKNGRVKVIAIKKDEGSSAVKPSEKTLADGSYPVALTQYLYWSEGADRTMVKAFVDFIAARRAHTMPKVASQN
jgi:phosphate transport system substrate-binding protein